MKVSQQSPKLVMLSKTSLILLNLSLLVLFSFIFLPSASASLNIGIGSISEEGSQAYAINIPQTVCQGCLGCNYSGIYVNNSAYWAGYTPEAYATSFIPWNYSLGNIFQRNLSAPVGIGTKTPTGLLEIKDIATTTVVISSGVGNENATLEFREADVPRASIEYSGLTGLLSIWSKYADTSTDVMMSLNTRTNDIIILTNLTVVLLIRKISIGVQ